MVKIPSGDVRSHGGTGLIDESALRASAVTIANRWPAVGLAVGVIREGRLAFFHAHGLADIASNTPIAEDTVFRIASITKTFTAIAVMQLWERGLVDLDAPANDYLRAYQLVPARASHPPATVRHLLTHTAGIAQVLRPQDWLAPVRGELRAAGQMPTLARYYRGGLRLVNEPGARFTYGDHGFATLGQIVEDVSGESLDRYLREHVFAPLGMASTDLLRSTPITARLATGYAFGSRGPRPVADGELVTAGAGSIYSTPSDMARYVAALLGSGANEHGAMLKPETLATMFAPHFQTDPRVAGMGLGFFRADVGGHRAIWHEGTLPGFDSQIWAAPDDGVGVMAFTNGSAGAMTWMPEEVAGLLRQVLGTPEELIRSKIPHHPELWSDLCGWYHLSAQWTDLQSRAMGGLGAEVFVRSGQLKLRVLSPIPSLYHGFTLHPDDEQDPSIFRIDLSNFALGTTRVVFSRDARGAVSRLHVDILPLWFEKRPAVRNPRLWLTGAAGALAAASVATAVRWRRRPDKGSRL
jgi:CubicO group peptidase (beta-lactamase class C family)